MCVPVAILAPAFSCLRAASCPWSERELAILQRNTLRLTRMRCTSSVST